MVAIARLATTEDAEAPALAADLGVTSSEGGADLLAHLIALSVRGEGPA